MNSNDELFYLKDSRTGKYYSNSGLVDDRNIATKFTEIQLKNRLSVPKTYTNVFREKMKNSGLVMEPVEEKVNSLIQIKSDIEFEDDDILTCSGKFYFKKGLVCVDLVVYSKYRNMLRVPDSNKGDLIKVELTVIRKCGKCFK